MIDQSLPIVSSSLSSSSTVTNLAPVGPGSVIMNGQNRSHPSPPPPTLSPTNYQTSVIKDNGITEKMISNEIITKSTGHHSSTDNEELQHHLFQQHQQQLSRPCHDGIETIRLFQFIFKLIYSYFLFNVRKSNIEFYSKSSTAIFCFQFFSSKR